MKTQTYTLLGGTLTLLNSTPRTPEDALWLAASVPTLPAGTHVLDAGCGNGVAGLALLLRQQHIKATGVDINPQLTRHASRHAEMNNLHTRYHTRTLNLLEDTLTPPSATFPIILSNPPFYPTEKHTPSSTQTQAKNTTQAHFTHWLKALHLLLTPPQAGVIPTPAIYLIMHPSLTPTLLAFTETAGYHSTLTPLETAPHKPAKRLLAKLTHGQGSTENIPLPIHNFALREKVLTQNQSLASIT